jgi:hypothetical protein
MNTEDDSARESMMLSEDQARRAFLKKAGRFAVVTPPAITLLLGTSLDSRAIAKSSGGGGGGGYKSSGGGGGYKSSGGGKGKSLSGDPRPGNGLGDQNHVHTGPPGQK